MVLNHRVLEMACRGEVEKVREYFAQNPNADPDETALEALASEKSKVQAGEVQELVQIAKDNQKIVESRQ